MSKKKWLLILLAAVLAVAAAVFVFWDSIAIYVAPKAVLSGALQAAMEDLQEYYGQSPVSLLAGHLDAEGRYRATMDMETEDALLGSVQYNMTAELNLQNNRIAAQGVVTTAQNDLDLSVYLDRDFMALSSEDLLGGAYYGITYETFSQDIRAIPLLSMFVSESVLSQWDGSVAGIQSAMNRSYQLPQLPEVSQSQIQGALAAVLLLPSDVARVQMTVNGEYADCFRISYNAQGEQVGALLGNVMDVGDGADASVVAHFYLHEKELVMAQVNAAAGENSLRCVLELNLGPTSRCIRLEQVKNGKATGFALLHQAETEGQYLQESWIICPDFEGKGESQTIRYRWEPVMGELVLHSESPVTLNLFETDAGLHIQTDHFEYLTGNNDADAQAVACKMILEKGTGVTTPAYKNIRDWSLEDLLVLLGGVGSLLGFKIP